MPAIEWTEEFSVGFKDIDKQHKKWVALYNAAHEIMMNPSSNGLTTLGKDALKEMINYANYHFAFEEQFMEEIGFKDLETHKALHRNFSKKLDQIALQMHQGETVLNSEIIKLIQRWLVEHILIEDKKYLC